MRAGSKALVLAVVACFTGPYLPGQVNAAVLHQGGQDHKAMKTK